MEHNVTVGLKDQPSTSALLSFIKEYRQLERAKYDSIELPLFGALAASSKDPQKMISHFRDHWRSKKKGFGQFFLNLAREKQLIALDHFGVISIYDPIYQEYALRCEVDRFYQFLNGLPGSAKYFYKLMLFFENYGIDQIPSPGMYLEQLPPRQKRFGNSANWGDYALSLEDPGFLFDQIFSKA